MALRKIIEVEGPSILQTSIGFIENGIQHASFSAYVKVININGNKNKLNVSVNFKGDVQHIY